MHPILRFRFVWIVLVRAGTGFLGWHAAHVRIDRTNDQMHSRNNPTSVGYEEFLKTFGNDETLVVAVRAPDVLVPATLTRLDGLTQKLAALPGVESADSLTNVAIPKGTSMVMSAEKLARRDDGWKPAGEILAGIRANPYLQGRVISADRTCAAIVVNLKRQTGAESRELNIRGVRTAAMADSGPDFEIQVAGFPLTELDIAEAIKRDQIWLIPLIFGVFAVLLVVLMRGWRGMILPLVVVAMTLAWTDGIYVLAGHTINTVTSLLSPVVMVISIEVAIHLVKHFEEVVGLGVEPRKAVDVTIRNLTIPCFLTTITTVFGFGSCLITTIPAIGQLGLFAAIGIVISWIVSFLVVPISLWYWPALARGTVDRPNPFISKSLAVLSSLSVRRPGFLIVGILVLAAAVCTGIPRLRVDTNLLNILKPSAPLVVASKFIDEHLTGVNGLEISFERVDGQKFDQPEDWRAIRDVEDRLRTHAEVTHVFALIDLMEAMSRAKKEEDPFKASEIRANLRSMRTGGGTQLAHYITADTKKTRLTARIRGVGSTQGTAIINDLNSFAAAKLGGRYKVSATGVFALMCLDSTGLVWNQMSSLGLSLSLCLLSMIVLFRSLRVGIISAIPNVLPIAMVFGYMGWRHYQLSAATAMIASAMIGIIVDNTIHVLSRFRVEFPKNAGVSRDAVRATLAETGQPILISTIILVLGFGSGCVGSFPPTIDFSFLSALTLTLGVLCNLLVLPACLVLMPGAVASSTKPDSE